MAALSGASSLCITDYPAHAILATLKRNVEANLPADTVAGVTIEGLDWKNASEVIEDLKSKVPARFST